MPSQRPEAIGIRLQQARRALGLQLGDIASMIHVRPEYLQALEEGRWEDLPSPAQARGFLRLYAEALGLDPKDLLSPPASQQAPTASPEPALSPSLWKPRLTREAEARLHQLGIRLQARRENLGLDYQAVAREIHVAPRYLQALEEGRLDVFTGPAQARGMLALYAGALGMDVDAVLAEFEALLPPRGPGWLHRFSRWLSGWRGMLIAVLVYGLVILGVVLVLSWGGYMLWKTQQQARTPTPTRPPVNTLPAPAITLPATPATAATPGTPAATPTPTPLPEQPTQEQAPIFVVVEARARVWLRVVEDGTLGFQGRLAPGERRTFRAEQRLELLTANAGALRVTYNQKPLGLMGDFGQMAFWIFTPQEIQTPTPTPTLTPTPTPTLLPTATPTATPSPLPTP